MPCSLHHHRHHHWNPKSPGKCSTKLILTLHSTKPATNRKPTTQSHQHRVHPFLQLGDNDRSCVARWKSTYSSRLVFGELRPSIRKMTQKKIWKSSHLNFESPEHVSRLHHQQSAARREYRQSAHQEGPLYTLLSLVASWPKH